MSLHLSSSSDNFNVTNGCSLSRSSVLQPRPPLLLTHGGTTYTLETNTSVRRSIENVDVTPPYGFVEVEPIDRHVVSTVSESILDLETNQKTITCDVCAPLAEQLTLTLHTLPDFVH